MNLRSTLLAATVLAVPLAAQAQPVTGLYIGAGAGVNWLTSEKVSTNSGVNTGTSLSSELGPAALGAVGWGFGNGLRVEVEGDYRNNKFNKLNNGSIPGAVGGREQKYGPMVNVAYDFYGLTPYVVPYIGAGVGYQWAGIQKFNAYGNVGTPSAFSISNSSNSTEGDFAYQVILGAGLPIAAVPGLTLTAEYRFMGLAGHRNYNATLVTTHTPPGGVPISFQLSNDYNNAFLVGFRYNFGVARPAPPPAPVAAPAPAPARSYLVFFDWDKATLTDRAREIIREAASNSTHVQYTQIVVNGYTDTSGTPRYNMGLSIRRANAVAAELVRDGVPRNVISIHGFGETHLLVPTGPGVREPQNRRVEIIIQ
jgi:OmpA-OmpF porin, OOP family